MTNLTDAVTKALRTIRRQADETTQAVLKGGRWLLVKNRENLTAEETAQLMQMLTVSPELKTCYALKEAFRTRFAESAERESAASGLCDWQTKAKATGLRSLQAFVKTLDNFVAADSSSRKHGWLRSRLRPSNTNSGSWPAPGTPPPRKYN